MTDIAGFVVCAALIFISGKRLSVYGDQIADITGMAKGWIGLILMATVTSLPELFVGISSAGVVKSPDLAVGDILGSCAFNLAILSLLDWFSPSPLSNRASIGHILPGILGIMLLSLVGLGLFLPQNIIILKWVGLLSVIFIAVYLLSIRILFSYQQRENKNNNLSKRHSEASHGQSLRKIGWLYFLNALVVIAAALFLPHFAEGIAAMTGMGESFVGTLFLAASTSLPEVAVSITALRIGSVDMAVGNLFGSNIFNILILSIDDIFYTSGNLLKDASQNNITSVFTAIIMTAIAIAGLIYRPEKKPFLLAWDALMILLVYIGNLILLYYLSN